MSSRVIPQVIFTYCVASKIGSGNPQSWCLPQRKASSHKLSSGARMEHFSLGPLLQPCEWSSNYPLAFWTKLTPPVCLISLFGLTNVQAFIYFQTHRDTGRTFFKLVVRPCCLLSSSVFHAISTGPLIVVSLPSSLTCRTRDSHATP